jgi:hypothetical protein
VSKSNPPERPFSQKNKKPEPFTDCRWRAADWPEKAKDWPWGAQPIGLKKPKMGPHYQGARAPNPSMPECGGHVRAVNPDRSVMEHET